MRANELFKQIRALLADDFVVAMRPDFPHLFVAPDVIVGGHASLVGVFVPKSEEISSPDKLLTRYALSRLGLPANLRCALLVDVETMIPKFPPGVADQFHEVLDFREYKRLAGFVRDAAATGRIKQLPTQIRRDAFRRADVLLKESLRWETFVGEQVDPRRISRELSEIESYKPVSLRRWTSWGEMLTTRRVPGLLQSQGTLVATLESPSAQAKLRRLRNLCGTVTQLDYALDNGIPYPTPEAFRYTSKLIVTDVMPRFHYDPDKSLRAAAFAGLAITGVESVDQIQEYGSHLRNVLEVAFHEH